MKLKAALIGLVGMLGVSALAQTPAKPPGPPQLTTEQRTKMAEAHEKMAACLRSTRPVSECHDEMMKTCQESMGPEGCPMMGGMGPMRHHGHMTQPEQKTPEQKK